MADSQSMISQVMRDVDSIIDRQRTLDQVKDALLDRAENPHEEDFIYDEVYGGERTTKEVIEGVTIERTVLHRRGKRDKDINGADLLFEIVGEKYILVQYKKTAPSDRVTKDSEQLEELIECCSNYCPPFSYEMLGSCGSWYCIIDGSNLKYMPACVADKKFGSNASVTKRTFDKALDRSGFLDLFAKCYIGARVNEWDHSPAALMKFAAKSTDPLIIVRQFGFL